MENAIAIEISPKNSNVLVFEDNGETIFTANSIYIAHPGGPKVENGFELIGQFFDYDEQYKRKTGIHKKGDYKLPAKTLKFLGFSGNSLLPSS